MSPQTSHAVLAPNTSGFDPDGVKGSEKTYAAKLLSKYLAGGQPASVDLYDFFLQRTAIPRKDSLHAVVVVGMRWNRRKSRCEFKVHNSWGATCDKYSDKFRKKDVCDKGDVWIEESLIRAQVVTMTTIEKVEMNGSKK